jgi:transcriptional regulator with XRE-family HTH domain
MEDVRAIFATNLRRLRNAAGLSQEELADRASVNRGYMSDIENARYYVTIKVLAKLADALGVEPAELLRRDKSRNSL